MDRFIHNSSFKIFITLSLFVILSPLGGFFWWKTNTLPVYQGKNPKEYSFIIRKGEKLSSIAQNLKEVKLIRSPLAFQIMVKIKNLSGKIQAGHFYLKPSLSLEEMTFSLTRGSSDIWLTFPEGWRREEIAVRLVANLDGFDYKDFLEKTKILEGFLFPDTYLIPKQASPSSVIKTLNSNFEKKFSAEIANKSSNLGLTDKEIVVLASIVEREAKYDPDRLIVSGILLKRLEKDWPLQTDATVQYAIANKLCLQNLKCEWWPPISKKEIELDSPYNTYRYKGLPPSPICNPGAASIKAVINPMQTSYWYYLSDKQGKMHYSQTIEEHQENIYKYLK